jgi:hypothetical protein
MISRHYQNDFFKVRNVSILFRILAYFERFKWQHHYFLLVIIRSYFLLSPLSLHYVTRISVLSGLKKSTMNKFLLSILLLVFTITFSFAQNANRKFKNSSYNHNTLEIATSDGNYSITAYSDKIVTTTFIPTFEKISQTQHRTQLFLNLRTTLLK